MLEVHALRKQAAQLRQDLSHALYKEDAAVRVLARVMRERDEAREALGNVHQTLGIAPSNGAGANGGDTEMELDAPQAEAGLTGSALERHQKTNERCGLSLV
jgi:pre-mRNA-processing factor 19